MLQKICCLTTDSCKGSCLGSSRNQNVKIAYIMLFFILYAISIFKNSSNNLKPSQQEIDLYHCWQINQTYQGKCVQQKKLTVDFLGLIVFHLIIMLFMLPKTKHIKIINQGLWIVKIIVLAVVVLLINLTFGPSVSEILEFLSTWASPFIYCILNIIFIDYVYYIDFKINDIAQKNSKFHILKVLIAIIFWLASIVANIFSYYQNQLWICVANSLLIAIFLILVLLRISRNNSLFVYAIIMFHFNLLSFSIHTQSDTGQTQIKQFISIEHGYRIFIAIFCLLAMLAEGGNQIKTKKSTLNQIFALNTTKKQQDNRYVSSNKWTIYHYIMATIAFGLPAIISYQYHSMEHWSGQFIQIGRLAWWTSGILVYLWSILVQKIYPQQDLGQLQNYFKQFQLN